MQCLFYNTVLPIFWYTGCDVSNFHSLSQSQYTFSAPGGIFSFSATNFVLFHILSYMTLINNKPKSKTGRWITSSEILKSSFCWTQIASFVSLRETWKNPSFSSQP